MTTTQEKAGVLRAIHAMLTRQYRLGPTDAIHACLATACMVARASGMPAADLMELLARIHARIQQVDVKKPAEA